MSTVVNFEKGTMNFKQINVITTGIIGTMQWRIRGEAPPATDHTFLNFIQFFGKSGKFVGLVPPPTGDPGFAPAMLPSWRFYANEETLNLFRCSYCVCFNTNQWDPRQ